MIQILLTIFHHSPFLVSLYVIIGIISSIIYVWKFGWADRTMSSIGMIVVALLIIPFWVMAVGIGAVLLLDKAIDKLDSIRGYTAPNEPDWIDY